MARRPGPTMMKRQKELARQQKQREKTERRKAAKEDRASGEAGEAPEEDPDIAGIVPGPQPGDFQER